MKVSKELNRKQTELPSLTYKRLAAFEGKLQSVQEGGNMILEGESEGK